MKRILVPIILSCLFVCQLKAQTTECKILSRTDGSITFEVDENLPAPKKTEIDKYRVRPGSEIAQSILSRYEIPKGKEGIIATSFQDEKITSEGPDVLFQAMLNAYANHRPLVLSPDMIWLVISQGFSHYVNEHAEELRDKLVSHDGKVDLVVQSGQDLLTNKNVDWDGIFNQFEQQLAANTKANIAKTITADFTTTGRTERIASQITLMSAVKEYFKYVVGYTVCGIPSITLQGTVTDWEKVLKKTQALEQFGMGWWTKQLEPILEEFVKAASGHPNSKFWKDIVMQDRPDRLRGGGCSDETPTQLDGWFLKLFPDVEKKTVPLTVPHNQGMKSEQVRVPFKYVIEDPQRVVLKTYDMEMIAGFVGVEEDKQTYALTPKIGWVVRRGNEEEDAIAKITNITRQDYYILPAEEVMPILQKIKHAEYLQLSFKGKVELPDWMDDMQIDHFTIYNDITADEEKALKKRFPKMEIKREKHYRDSVVKFIK